MEENALVVAKFYIPDRTRTYQRITAVPNAACQVITKHYRKKDPTCDKKSLCALFAASITSHKLSQISKIKIKFQYGLPFVS
jgi:hypothetical protein